MPKCVSTITKKTYSMIINRFYFSSQTFIKSMDSNYYFNGLGYSVTTRDKKYPYRSSQTSIHFSFKTYDEDALLFLVLDAVNVSIP